MVSVIICTHNPRREYLHRVLEALKVQTLAREDWELLVIDNASREPLAGQWDLSWHPAGRILREEETGLTPARLRGIKESTGELIIFVDDDNVLAADYLAQAARLAAEWPTLGAFGANITGEYEIPPAEWIKPYLEGLAIRELERDYWSNLGGLSPALPCGAGLCIRRPVATDYFHKTGASSFRKLLGRSGAHLGAGEDSDLAECAIDAGFGTGCFRALRLIHLIPKGRMTTEYIIRLYAGFAASDELLKHLRPKPGHSSPRGWEREIRFFFNLLKAKGLRRQILRASHQARKDARRMIFTVSNRVQP
jgi:glycosyltransferase involved in cell wall biosynthesis